MLGMTQKRFAAGYVFGMAVTADGCDYGACAPALLAQALLCQHVHLPAVWARSGMHWLMSFFIFAPDADTAGRAVYVHM